ncbi:hypothetical protein PUN28_019327 [Cardiocondyla obscurior]|uniref:Uncharacterized protein n=1 Tax=Cardiocondyla obscurior TaxID=286306 RepID=A0AAW2EBT0_9HYME
MRSASQNASASIRKIHWYLILWPRFIPKCSPPLNSRHITRSNYYTVGNIGIDLRDVQLQLQFKSVTLTHDPLTLFNGESKFMSPTCVLINRDNFFDCPRSQSRTLLVALTLRSTSLSLFIHNRSKSFIDLSQVYYARSP